ncbi:RDD family protein [Paenibacillus antri]|uniref:RDD family protein n=1 Tax=Paenibacillus antri TaxID=2582848 RepID=A0A5R9GAF5_9BACL|nr:RDD family protein [Paenibacillus antri]TLS49703.1 RDD family protein [Paenibacillus antri]
MNEFHEAAPPRRIVVTTPEHVELRFETAGIGSRVGAQLIDTLILLLVNVALVLAWMLVAEAVPVEAAAWLDEYAAAIAIVVLAALNGGYFLIGEYATGGRTIGKRAMGLRVMQDNGRPLSFVASVIRNLLRVIDTLPMLYVVGALCSFFHPHDKRLGDLAAGTVVVYDVGGAKKRTKRMEKQLRAWGPFLPELTLEPWTRERVNEEEWELLSAFAERLPYLAPRRAEELAKGVVSLIAPKLGLGERWAEALEAASTPWSPARSPAPAPAPGTGPLEAASQASEEPSRPQTAQQHSQPPPRPAPSGRPAAVAWALALYMALRQDWELLQDGGGA